MDTKTCFKNSEPHKAGGFQTIKQAYHPIYNIEFFLGKVTQKGLSVTKQDGHCKKLIALEIKTKQQQHQQQNNVKAA